ncbi:hypothetical protein RRG08_062562 [Elysia crispata]|uniref:Uncharacterized protein n=1 Tax=Elysia crispata TaxID=231223 RepID=A0AAE1AMD7_9GAST|nr:hypothetical protein RRG08_062562 [Elysia crispata]
MVIITTRRGNIALIIRLELPLKEVENWCQRDIASFDISSAFRPRVCGRMSSCPLSLEVTQRTQTGCWFKVLCLPGWIQRSQTPLLVTKA